MEQKAKRNGKFISTRDVKILPFDLNTAHWGLDKVIETIGKANVVSVEKNENEVLDRMYANIKTEYTIKLNAKTDIYRDYDKNDIFGVKYMSRKMVNPTIVITIYNQEGVEREGSSRIETQLEVYIRFYGVEERRKYGKRWECYDNKHHFGYAYGMDTLFEESIIPSVEEFVNAHKPLLGK
jgi:hypothetical protein